MLAILSNRGGGRAKKWTTEDDEQSLEQGWGLFTVYGSKYVEDGTVQLQKSDEEEIFKDDYEAWTFVWAQANQRNTLAVKALQFILEYNPKEYSEIKKIGETKS